jgi:hypothetical protein
MESTRMTLEEILSRVTRSNRTEWSWLTPLPPTATGDGPWYVRGCFKPNPALTIAFGYKYTDHYTAPWLPRVGDIASPSTACWQELRLHGEPIVRQLLVVVDGFRSYLPVPAIDKERGYFWNRRQLDLARLLPENKQYFDEHVKQANVGIVDDDLFTF